MKKEFASAGLTVGQINAIVKKMGGHDEALRFLRGELMVSPVPSWREVGGVIYFRVTSDGTTGREWVRRLRKKHFRFDDDTQELLMSPSFKSTSGVTTEVAVFKGTVFGDRDRSTDKIRGRADILKFCVPNAELACLIREKFEDEEIKAMGLRGIVVMHEPFDHPRASSSILLGVRRDVREFGGGDYTGRELCSYWADHMWSSLLGFALAVSQVSLES